MKLIFILIIVGLSSTLINTLADPIQLQILLREENERYVYNFEDLSKFGISNILWPANLPQNQRVIPYSDNPVQTVSQSTTSLASISVSDTQKNLIGYYMLQKPDNSFDVYIMFYTSIVNSNSGVLERKELSSLLLVSGIVSSFKVYASFADINQGFVSYQGNGKEIQGIVRFQYQDGVGLSFDKTVMNYLIKDHVVVVGQNSSIYIVTVIQNQISLYKYNPDNVLNLKHSIVLGQEQLTNVFVDTLNLLMWYSTLNQQINTATVDLSKEKLVISSDSSSLMNVYYQGQSLQRIQNMLVFVLSNNDSSLVVQLQVQQNLLINQIEIVKIDQISYSLSSKNYLINHNIVSFIKNFNLFLLNLKTNQIIFIQTLDYAYYSFDPSESIDKQIILSTQMTNDQKQTENIIKTININNPSMIIYGSSQTLNFSLTSQFGIVQKYTLNVNYIIYPATQFIQDSIQISNLITQTNIDNQLFDIEKYIIGQNIDLQLTVDSDSVIQNVSIKQIISRPVNQMSLDPKQLVSVHHTDGFYQSIFMTTKGNNINYVSATLSYLDVNEKVYINIYPSSMTFDSYIDIIDNYGVFTVEGSRTIYIPFILQDSLSFNYYETNCDNKNTFAFASDMNNSYLYVKCGGEIQQISYEYSGDDNTSLYVLSQTKINFDASSFTSLISIQGNLFISNDSQITCYNAVTKTLAKNVLTVKQIQGAQKQQIIFFSSTFLVVVQDNPVAIIQQYSYGKFQSQDPVYLRSLYISPDFQINPNNNQFIIRDNIEYFFIATSDSSNYLIYRINNNISSQNQFYTTTTILPPNQSINIINSEFICQLGQVMKCDQILQSASIQYEIDISQKTFNQGLVFPATVTLKIGNVEQIYNIFIQRDASTQYGVLNQDAPSLQKLRTTLQDTNFTSGQQYFFNDLEVFNSCIPGWNGLNDVQYQILNRIKNTASIKDNVVFTILYNQKANVQDNSLTIGNDLLIISGDFKSCIILDDQSSKVSESITSFTINIYGVCPTQLITMNFQFTVDDKGNYLNASVVSNTSQPLIDQFNQQYNYQRIITIGNDLVIFNYSGSQQYQISENQEKTSLEISFYVSKSFSLISYNVINSLNLQLQFSSNGFIFITNTNTKQNSQVFIQDLLAISNFFVDSTDQIQGLIQYSDSSFRIVFLNSFIYDVTFELDANNQLKIIDASLYYYKDSLQDLIITKSTSTYSLLVGNGQFGLTVALYNNKNKLSNQLLIQSSYNVSYNKYSYFPSFIEQTDTNKFILYLSNGETYNLEISDQVGIQFRQSKSSFGSQNAVIYIQGFNEVKNWVQLSFQSPQPVPVTYQPILMTTLVFVIFLQMLL